MFIEINSTQISEKATIGSLKSALALEKDKLENYKYYVLNKNLVYLFKKSEVGTSESFLTKFKLVKFVKENLHLQKFFIYAREGETLFVLTKEKEKYILEEVKAKENDLKAHLSIVYFNQDFDNYKFFYIENKSLENISTELAEISEENPFVEINISIEESDLLDLKEEVNQLDEMKQKFQNSKVESSVLKKIFAGLIILGLAGYGYYMYQEKVAEEKRLEEEALRAESQKPKIDLSIVNKNNSKVIEIEKYLDRNASLFTLKDLSITANVSERDVNEIVLSSFDIIKGQVFIQKNLELKQEIKEIKQVENMALDSLYEKYNRKGYKTDGFVLIVADLTKEDLKVLLDDLRTDNLYSFDIYLKKDKDTQKYFMSLTIFKEVVKPAAPAKPTSVEVEETEE